MPEQRPGTTIRDREWRLALAAAYGVGVWLVAHLNVPHFMLVCGLNVAVLLLTPYRIWPMLAVAQSLSQVPIAVTCASSFGVLWSSLMLIPSIILIGPIVYYYRMRAALFDRNGQVHVGKLLCCCLAIALAITGLDEIQFMTVVYPVGVRPMHYDHLAAQWVLGNLIGMLAVVPTVLAVQQAAHRYGWGTLFVIISESRSTVESILFIAPVLVLLAWAGFTEPKLRGLAQVAMFVPVVWLALRHGWQGAAWGGTAASLTLVWLMPAKYDYATIQAEVILALAICTMLLLGARIDVLDRRAEEERKGVRTALSLAQRNVQLGELQLRMTAMALEQARETVRAGYAMMMGRLRHLQPAIDDSGYQRVAWASQEQLSGISENLYPTVYRERGFPAALREGTVPRLLDQAGIRYWCELKGPLSALSPTVHLAIYRMVCEAIADGCSQRDISDICVRIRGGDLRGRHGAAVSVAFHADLARLPHVQWDHMLPHLVRTTTGAGIKAIQDRAAIFEGYARKREFAGGRRISWLMLDL